MREYVGFATFFLLAVFCMCMGQSRNINPFLTLPVKQQVVITEGWNYDAEVKFHPDTQIHSAVDFQAPRGTPVFAAADGLAVQSFHTSYLDKPYVDESGKSHRLGFGIGHFIQIWHPEQQVFTSYCHLEKVDPAVPYVAPTGEHGLYAPAVVYLPLDEMLKSCKPVKRGQLIGYIGDTGLSDNYEESPDVTRDHGKLPTWDPAGPHLHFEVYTRNAVGRKDQRWDPYGIYGKASNYASGKPATTGNLWLIDNQGRPKSGF
jgi:murein DD-endopeptidase MepM/ murein hydrolase activator NlpD